MEILITTGENCQIKNIHNLDINKEITRYSSNTVLGSFTGDYQPSRGSGKLIEFFLVEI